MFVRSGATSNAVVAATSNAVAYPTLVAGDLLMLVAVIGNNPTVGADPTGFAVQAGLSSSAATLTVRCYLRIADGTESGSATVTWTGAQNSVAAMVAVQGYTGASIVLDPAVSPGVSSGTAYTRAGGNVGLSGKPDGCFAIAAGTNSTGTPSISVNAGIPYAKIAEAYGGSTPFLGLAIACAGELQPGGLPGTFQGTDTRTTTANYTATFGVQLPYPSSYTESDVPAVTNLETYADQFSPALIPGAPPNLEYIAAAGSAAWPASGQGWPRIKQG